MEEQFVPYELALKLKDLGFDEECFTCYCNHWKDMKPYLWELNQPDYGEYWDLNSKVNAPLWQQAFDWFRVQYSLDGTITSWKRGGDIEFLFSIEKIGSPSIYRNSFSTYEEARLECLKKLIEIVER